MVYAWEKALVHGRRRGEHAAMEVVDLEDDLAARAESAPARPRGRSAGAQALAHRQPERAHAVKGSMDIEVEIDGHVGYYCAGMNKLATVRIHGNASTGIAENMMSGRVEVEGNVSQSAGATGRGGLLVVRGNASSRCGISMKGIDIVVGGSVGHMSAFMAQTAPRRLRRRWRGARRLDLRGAAVRARLGGGLGADCVEKALRDEHLAQLRGCSTLPRSTPHPAEFRRYGSARQPYTFKVDNAAAY